MGLGGGGIYTHLLARAKKLKIPRLVAPPDNSAEIIRNHFCRKAFFKPLNMSSK